MSTVALKPAKTEKEINDIAILANEIWHQHFIPIIGEAQVEYMVAKFQSYPAITGQIQNDGYEYFQIFIDDKLAGYTGVHAEDQALFLSKLYIHEDFRGNHLATKALNFLIELCKERGLKKIWLTCNKYNSNTLAIYDHLGFEVTDEQVADIGNGFVMDDYILRYVVDDN